MCDLFLPRILSGAWNTVYYLELVTGVSMGFGTYSVMPIPLYMAIVWLIGSIVEMALGGIIVGAIIKEESSGLKRFFGR